MPVPFDAIALLCAITLVGVAPILLGSKRDLVVSPRFWMIAVYLAVFAIRPLCILIDPDYAHPYIRSQLDFHRLVVSGLTLALAGLVVFWVGYSLPVGRRLSSLVPLFGQQVSPRRWQQAVLGCFLVGLGAYLILVRSMGGLRELLAVLYMRAAVYEADETAGPMKELAKLIGVSALLEMHYHVRIRRTWWAWPLLVAGSVIIGTMGGRGAVAQLWVMTYLFYALAKPRYRKLGFVGALALGVFLFAVVALSARRSTRGGLDAAAQTLRTVPKALVENALDTVPMFDQMVAAMQIAGRDIPYCEGSSYLALIPIMVPRALWPINTETAGVTLRKVIEPQGIGGRPSTIMGEGYLNFGVIGALVPMFLLGIWCRLLHAYLVRGENQGTMVTLLYVFGLFSTLNLLTGVGPLAVRALVFRVCAALIAYAWSARKAACLSEGARRTIEHDFA